LEINAKQLISLKTFFMHTTRERTDNKNVLTVRDMPHFAPYLQFIVNILQIHFEHVKLGHPDHGISGTMVKQDFDELYDYLYQLAPDQPVEIMEKDARVLYACLVVVSRLMLCEYGEEVCGRLIRHLPSQHRWHQYEVFRNDLLRHNTQLLLDMDTNMLAAIRGLDLVKEKLEAVTI
jgi:hypothetical protein